VTRKPAPRKQTADRGPESSFKSVGRPIGTGRLPRAILYLAFTLSGLTGLIYETTWTRYLQLFLGHAAYAQVLVLALFMGGMGAGAFLAACLSRTRLPALAAYAAIEAILGLLALAFHPVFAGTTAFAYDTLLPGTLGSTWGQVLQWTLGAALILPQSILLGMTFPLMSSAILRLGVAQPGRVFAMLYFANSLGAAIGVMFAGFWLIEMEGMQATMEIAGIGNFVVASVALGLARIRKCAQAAVQRDRRAEGASAWLLAIAFLTAVSSFLYEVGWLRMLALVQGASTHAFETMLSAFILGIALGGLWIHFRIAKVASPLATLGHVHLLMGLAALATLPLYPFSFDLMQRALPWLLNRPNGYTEYSILGYLISATIMVPASFFAGMTLPLLTHVLYEHGRGESEIGAVYGWNALGGIVGVALGGLLLMPLIGLKNMMVLGSALDIGIGIAIAAMLSRSQPLPASRASLALCGVAAVAVLAGLFLFQLDPRRLASGVFRTGLAELPDTSQVHSYTDGRTASVATEEHRSGAVVITTNGKPDASIRMTRAAGNNAAPPAPDEYTMTLLAALPLAYAPSATQAAIIGHGSGLSTHVLLGSPTIEHVDVIEIEPEMIRASEIFRPRVERAYTDQRAQFHIEDARTFFARTPRKYDIILSEPSNPWVSGVASLYTPEFYRQLRSALAPGGLFVQWFHLYEIDRPMVRSIVSALGTGFTDWAMYASNDADVLLVVTPSGALPPPTDAIFDWPLTRAELETLGIASPAQLRLFEIATRRAYAPLLEGARPNTDYFPLLEFGAARTRFAKTSDAGLIALARDPVPILEMLSHLSPPRPVPDSQLLAGLSGRFRDLAVANLLLAALNEAPGSAIEKGLPEKDRDVVTIIRKPPPGDSERDWNRWALAVLALAKPTMPNGGWPALEKKLSEPSIASALARAPQSTRDKLEFLGLVGRRDLDGIRDRGRQLLAGTMESEDPAFHSFILVSTMTACLAETPDLDCRWVISLLDRVRRQSPVFDLLRAHQRALYARFGQKGR
jgi:spermidine synthase